MGKYKSQTLPLMPKLFWPEERVCANAMGCPDFRNPIPTFASIFMATRRVPVWSYSEPIHSPQRGIIATT